MQYENVIAQNWDVVIIGGGPGGMGAAIYTARANLSTLIVEKQFLGGLIALTHEVENYPAVDFASGMELAQRMEAQVKKFGAETIFKETERIDKANDGSGFVIKLTDGKEVRARSIVVACGSAPRRLPVAGEKEFYGKGVSYCATCDGRFFKEKEVVVVGGGESAFQEGLFLTQFVSKVTLVHRREGFRATELAQQRAKETGKWFQKLNYTLEEIYGDGMVTGVRIKHTHTGEVEDLKTDGVFGFIGYDPKSGFVKHLVDTDDEGYICTDRKMRTSCRGIWAAGDIVEGALKQMVISAGNGATAAMDIREYLQEQ